MAIKVHLRKKSISKARYSLYLDIYPPVTNPETGRKTRRQFLGLYIKEKPKTTSDRQNNKETLQLAEQIRFKQENHLNKPEIYSGYEKEQLRIKQLGEKDFIEYYRTLAYKRKSSNHKNWMSALKHLEQFAGDRLRFADLNERLLEDFKEYLLTTQSSKSGKALLSQNSALSYFNKIKAALKQAYKDGLLVHDLNGKVSSIKEAETNREYLTIEELNRLAETHCNNDLLKRAALFSALTGLRFSDIEKLKWQEIVFIPGDGYLVSFRQKKTKSIESLPISEQARNLLGERGAPDESVFNGLGASYSRSKHLAQWLGAAGITKKITFHCFRHTYATLQLYNGTDIYTVSKMLGHKSLKTTQVYAKIVDKAKREAAGKINLDM